MKRTGVPRMVRPSFTVQPARFLAHKMRLQKSRSELHTRAHRTKTRSSTLRSDVSWGGQGHLGAKPERMAASEPAEAVGRGLAAESHTWRPGRPSPAAGFKEGPGVRGARAFSRPLLTMAAGACVSTSAAVRTKTSGGKARRSWSTGAQVLGRSSRGRCAIGPPSNLHIWRNAKPSEH
ncbi:hypothetical protein HPB52_011963 [Rhipicephalus sanguineus]|uniref:Uncharacterized protein n=1 Tax=Rhipicephalus sanguineus TaxID=34632 RepID=A0A9D4T9P2_RHISA|nr:hypothetical protein HPB52_011963 [Rhipicephalus sanguineus]